MTELNYNQKNNKGFIALFSVILISFVLLLVTTTLSFAGFSGRFNILESEYKKRSRELAEACLATARLKLAENNFYSGNGIVSVGSDTCHYQTTGDSSGGGGFLYPDEDLGVGNYDQWDLDGDTSNFTKESAMSTNDGNTSNIKTSNDLFRQSFVFPNADIPIGSTIDSVTVIVRAKRDGGDTSAPDLRFLIERGSDSTDRIESSGIFLAEEYTIYEHNMTANPFGGPWTVEEVNNWTLRFGATKDGSNSNTRITEMYIVVNASSSSGSEGEIVVWAEVNNVYTYYFADVDINDPEMPILEFKECANLSSCP